MRNRSFGVLALPLLISSLFAQANSNLSGQSGLIQMPDARMGADGTWRIGMDFQSPYRAGWSSISVTPWLEGSARFTRFGGLTWQQQGYGDAGDKAFAGKLLLSPEDGYLPALAVGIDDFEGTGLFSSQYLVASKQLGPVDVSLGYGRKRIDGTFGGIRYRPSFLPGLSLVGEYDANNYSKDQYADKSGVDKRKKGANIGVEYQWGWLNGQVGRLTDGTISANAYLSIPLNKKEFIPKVDEPAPLVMLPPRPTEQQWRENPQYRRNLLRALDGQDFRDIRFSLQGNALQLNLANTRIAKPSRAAGRAARIALAYVPFGTRQITITLEQSGSGVLTYQFTDTDALASYFNGTLSRERLAQTVTVRYASPNDQVSEEDMAEVLTELSNERYRADFQLGDNAGELGQFAVEDLSLSKLRIAPKIGFYFNDPSGVLKYDLYLQSGINLRLAKQTFFETAVSASVLENVSSVSQDSNSRLPHVRSDVAEYKRDGKVTLERALLNQYYHLGPGLYGRASVGLYEEMFGGAGGQVLYQPAGHPFAFDVALDRVRQRGTAGDFRFRDYETTTAIASLHYRMPSQGLVATVRAGRFLAGDEGARFELARRFGSGVEMGAWYTITNGNDTTSPGSVAHPYRDKGIYMSVPLNIMLTKDTSVVGSYGISPWTRDVGQMVASPGDLYSFAARFIRSIEDRDGLTALGDLDDDYPMRPPETMLRRRPLGDFGNLVGRGVSDAFSASGVKKALAATGAVWLASRLDNRVERRMGRDAPGKREQKLIDIGNALPWAGLALSGGLAVYEGDDRLSTTAYSALLAGVTTGVAAEAGKWAVGRSRPNSGRGNGDFDNFSKMQSRHSFPSSHVAVATAVVTPFAQEYDMPALYVLPGLTQYARLRTREHWFSDVVAGSALGMVIGGYTWEWNRKRNKHDPAIQVGARSISLNWDLP